MANLTLDCFAIVGSDAAPFQGPDNHMIWRTLILTLISYLTTHSWVSRRYYQDSSGGYSISQVNVSKIIDGTKKGQESN